jgi:predicted phosphodiesterase
MTALMCPLAAPAKQAGTEEAGRTCPRDYVYTPSVLARIPDLATDTLYVVGGLYGNLAAFDAVKRLAARERAQIVFNGDFHWFDAEPQWFAAIERKVAPYLALRGNVETEIARQEDIGAGCGCAYPASVDSGVIRRSNEILMQLRAAAPDRARTRLRRLPMHLVVQVGVLRIAIVHGDATSLAGWYFAHDAFGDEGNRRWLEAVYAESHVDVFACTHTCLAVLRDVAFVNGRLTVINNGAAGMPNFAGSRSGVVTRIATSPSPHQPLYGLRRDGVHIDALAVDYDHDAFLEQFLARWPANSPAHESYYKRIMDGLNYLMTQAAPQ